MTGKIEFRYAEINENFNINETEIKKRIRLSSLFK
ncbi:hypothetical protein Pan241w_24070 [Gimesia alba]|uniref:Uncharacterized protein n=1 Tax=Gimesia alba TaxID=2527973 RepID=A0A517REM3_9PLAN|nr:hypothetical protein Pan241w_24070 [Gimesia alba]